MITVQYVANRKTVTVTNVKFIEGHSLTYLRLIFTDESILTIHSNQFIMAYASPAVKDETKKKK